MIAKMVKGRGFRGAVEYDIGKEGGSVIYTNMAGTNARELAAEFGEIRKLRPNLGRAVMHVSLSAAPGEVINDAKWLAISERYLRGMGLTDNQVLITKHTDTEHPHIHILANRITHSGGVVSDGQDYKRQEVIMREIERDFGLQAVAPSADAERKAPTKGEIEGAIRTGQPSTRQQLQQLCDAAAKGCGSFSEYLERLEAAGVELVPVAQLNGAKLSGLSYRLDGVTMKGSDLGKSYTAAGVQKRGISYEQDRDGEAVSRSIKRDATRAFGEPDRDGQSGEAQQRGGLSDSAGAFSASAGSADRRDAPDADRDRQQGERAGRQIPAPVDREREGIQGSGGRGERSGRELEQGRAADGVDTLRAGGSDRAAYSGASDRLLDLAGARRDRTLEAIQRQLTALGAARYEVGVRDAKTGQMINREWSRAELEQAGAWLKRMNARGNDVYLRPAGQHGLVLVDDLPKDALERMRREGLAPAAVIETSPGNYQTWVKLSDSPLSAAVRHSAARELAKHYGGDMNSADSKHYGRLAGFTNQKPQHSSNGRQPYVLAHDCGGSVAKAAPRFLTAITDHLARAAAQKERAAWVVAMEQARPGELSSDPVHEYQRQAKRLLARYGKDADLSRMDWMIAVDMSKSGQYSASEIERAITECSPEIESRKAGHIEDYARRTAAKAALDPEVQQRERERAEYREQLQEQEQERRQPQEQRGRDNSGPSR